ncbi:MAG: glutamine synthetase type III, partial [Bacteroidota bacterium]|nr:glutamine synthetase type III [Bacteroidota bacterium]
NYSDEWKDEAKKRGLDCEACVPIMYDANLTKQSMDMFIRTKVYTEREMESRTEVRWDLYTKKVQIESRVLADLSMNHILPIVLEYQTMLISNVQGMKNLFGADEFKKLAARRIELISEISKRVDIIEKKVNEMVEARKVANLIESDREKALSYATTIFPFFDEIRYHIDKLELIVDNEKWPLPKYRELLFIR